MRSIVFVSFFTLIACGPGPEISPPHDVVCPTLDQAIVGTWTREGGAMEIRIDGAIVRDAVEGAFRWTTPGRATIDMRGSHEEHTIGLMTINTLLDVDANGRAIVWTRISPSPPAPEGCVDLRGSLIGRWTDGATEESFAASGLYTRGDRSGVWQLIDASVLQVRIEPGPVIRYRVALASPSVLVSAVEDMDAGEPERGRSSVETRLP